MFLPQRNIPAHPCIRPRELLLGVIQERPNRWNFNLELERITEVVLEVQLGRFEFAFELSSESNDTWVKSSPNECKWEGDGGKRWSSTSVGKTP